MRETNLQISNGSTRWGLVEVLGDDGLVVRSHRITADEAQAAYDGKAIPPGCTAGEWESGRVIVSGRPLVEGMAYVNPNGSLMVNKGIVEKNGFVEVALEKWAPDAWDITANGRILSGKF